MVVQSTSRGQAAFPMCRVFGYGTRIVSTATGSVLG